jgi:uncharacterized protein (TIGR03663 family)
LGALTGGHASRLALAAVLVITLGGLLFRFPDLQSRPLHTDEAVHMVKAGILLETGRYEYNPSEYHGPTLYYLALPLMLATGAREFAAIPNALPFLLVMVAAGTLLILSVLLLRADLGPVAVTVAALLTALSPAMIYYSRYYIQEMLLVLLTLLLIATGWRYARTRHLVWMLLSGLLVGLMLATKETVVIALFVAGISGALALLWGKWLRHEVRMQVPWWHLTAGIVLAAAVALVILTGFFTNPAAIGGSVHAYLNYVVRGYTGDSVSAGESVHVHPWHFYLQRILYFHEQPGPWWSEGLIVGLALAGLVAVAAGRVPAGVHPGLARFLAIFAVLLTAVYSLIPYKTPWNALGFLHTMILMAGIGAAALFALLQRRWLQVLFAVVLAAAAVHLGMQAYRANFRFAADPRNPWVYAGTSPDLVKLARRVEEIAGVHPDRGRMLVQVVAPGSDYWPLPWYLRRLENVGYYETPPEPLEAPVIVASADLEELDARLEDGYTPVMHGLRPDVLMNVWVLNPLWEDYVQWRAEQ